MGLYAGSGLPASLSERHLLKLWYRQVAGREQCRAGKIEPSGESMTEKVERVYEELLRDYPAA